MDTYTVAVDVKKIYHVQVEADSAEAAKDIVDAMQSETIYEMGSLQDVDVEIVGAEKSE